MNSDPYKLKVFGLESQTAFDQLALEIFRFQYNNNQPYRTFVDGVCRDISAIKHYSQIPCLPVEFYKTHKITSTDALPELVFRSSGTTGQVKSTHNVYSEEVYRQSILQIFTHFYGEPSQYIICALTPDSRTHKDSSLAYMLNYLAELSSYEESGFYLGEENKLAEILIDHPETKKIVFGVTYALINFSEQHSFPLQNTIIIETGGMKGKMKEMTRVEVHKVLSKAFSCPIHSEYSMAELMSQAYMTDSGAFACPSWMKILIREANNPMALAPEGKTGGINIIDLANYHTCSFISTKDLGSLHHDKTFEVLGRFDFSDIRGCNLLSVEL
ncbi:MAG: acyl transferase [Bacteroidota bacterium]